MNEYDTTNTDEVVCPHCGYEHRCSYDLNLDGYPAQIECQSCGKSFEAWHNVSVTYYSREIIP